MRCLIDFIPNRYENLELKIIQFKELKQQPCYFEFPMDNIREVNGKSFCDIKKEDLSIYGKILIESQKIKSRFTYC